MRVMGGIALLVAVAAVLAACGAEALPDYRAGERSYSAVYAPGGGNTHKGADYARGVLADDPDHRTITDAFVRDDDILGLVVRPEVSGPALRDLLLILAPDMGSKFRRHDVEVIAYDERTREALARAVFRADTAQTSYSSVR